ncbi:tRNA (guanine-N(7)-)-methyltransferase non-catalytic subunit trm82 [Saitoella coloradoensis]
MVAHPLQTILSHPSKPTLFAAIGPHLRSYNLNTGATLAKWSAPAPPADKKPTREEILAGNAIRTMVLTKDGSKLAVSGEDKVLRVFDASTFELISERTVPKRVCSLALVDNDATILTGDKHGDVFSYPFMLQPEERQGAPAEDEKSATAEETESPAAGSAAKKQGKVPKGYDLAWGQKKKDPDAIPENLLLGHVSMLTTMSLLHSNSSTYIMTADRDEHVRISRYPKAYVTERFLLGHTEFVSSVAQLDEDVVLTAGGDPWVGVWNWKTGKLLHKLDLAHAVQEARGEDGKIAVSQFHVVENRVFVIVEKAPAVFVVDFSDDKVPSITQTIALSAPALALVTDYASRLWASVDTTEVSSASVLVAFEADSQGKYKSINAHSFESLDVEAGLCPFYTTEQLRKRRREPQADNSEGSTDAKLGRSAPGQKRKYPNGPDFKKENQARKKGKIAGAEDAVITADDLSAEGKVPEVDTTSELAKEVAKNEVELSLQAKAEEKDAGAVATLE